MARRRKKPEVKEAGLFDYLKAAFTFRWNLLFFFGAAAAAALSPVPEVALPLIGAAELAYLTAMAATPKFQAAIDAKVYHESRGDHGTTLSGAPPKQSLQSLVTGLSAAARVRFEQLRHRCVEMQSIASGVGGRANRKSDASELQGSGLDRLLWVFLRLLYSKTSLGRFLGSTDVDDIERRVGELREQLAEAESDGDERSLRSLRDSFATQELRLDNYRKAEKNAKFVDIELDRLEGKIQTLSEMAVNRQDPDFISREVDSVAESMNQTEAAISELSMVDGLLDDLAEPPPILGADLREVISDG